MKVKSLSRVQLLATLWTAAYQAPLSMGINTTIYKTDNQQDLLYSPERTVLNIVTYMGKESEKEWIYVYV